MIAIGGRILEEIDLIPQVMTQQIANKLVEGSYVLFEQNNHCDCNIWLINPNEQKLMKRADRIYTRQTRYVSEIVNSDAIKNSILECFDKIVYLKRLTMQELDTWKISVTNTLSEKIESLKSEDNWLKRNIESIYQGCRMEETNLFLYKLNPYSI